MLVYVLICIMAATAFANLFPETPTGRILHRMLVEAPARWLSELNPRRLLVAALTVAVLILLLTYIAPLGVPFDLAISAAFDTTAYLEIMATLAASAVLLRSRAAWLTLRTRVARLWRRVAVTQIRRLRSRPARRAPARPAVGRRARQEDEDPGRAWAFAVA
jgi:hypothetical protein